MPNTTRTTAQSTNGCITIQGPHGFIQLSPNCARKIAVALHRAADSLDRGAPHATIDAGLTTQSVCKVDSPCERAREGGAA